MPNIFSNVEDLSGSNLHNLSAQIVNIWWKADYIVSQFQRYDQSQRIQNRNVGEHFRMKIKILNSELALKTVLSQLVETLTFKGSVHSHLL